MRHTSFIGMFWVSMNSLLMISMIEQIQIPIATRINDSPINRVYWFFLCFSASFMCFSPFWLIL